MGALSAAFVDGEFSFINNSRFLPAVPVIAFTKFSFSVVAAIDLAIPVIRPPRRGHR
jgi:hypothetical protein